MSTDRLELITRRLRDFVTERDWAQFHTPKNLSMLLASEVGELLAEFRWEKEGNTDETARKPEARKRIEHEIGDIAVALLLLCDRVGVDLLTAVETKMKINAENYPVDSSRGQPDRRK